MTSKNFTIDNVNPLIQYSPPGAWGEGTALHDLQAHFYSNSTFTLCNTTGSSATFTFNGTKVYVFGGKRMNHGKYSITIDSTQSKTFDGFANPEIIPAPLWVSDPLRLGQHTVIITNEWTDPSKPDLDIDSITWTTSVSNDEPMTLEDTAGAFSYSPPTSWTTNLPEYFTGFSNSNGHTTLATGASVTVSFSGDFISFSGPVGPTIAPYRVEVDGVDRGTYNATKASYTPQVVLYQATGLGAEEHTLRLISQPASDGQMLAIDKVELLPATKKSSSVGPAVGGAVGGVVVLALLVLLIFFHCWRKRRREQDPSLMVAQPFAAPAFVPTPYTTDLDAGGGNPTQSNKGGLAPLPPTANVHPEAPRMYVPGREQDLGPLPPDYEQATEPYSGAP